LGDPHGVAGRVPKGAVARAPALVDEFLEHLGPGGLRSLERGIDII